MNLSTDHPRVSCIVAVYNGETYLRETIDSILAQDYPNVEVIVVDDGSTDRSGEILTSYGDRIRTLTQENRGVSIARNRGVELSTGSLISFQDADDLMEPNRFSKQASTFAADPELDFCDCHSANFWSPELSIDRLQADGRYAQPFWKNPLPGYIISWLFRRKLWDRVGGFAEGMKYSEDTDWFSRAKDTSMKRLTLPDVLIHRRLHPNNVTARRDTNDMTSLADTVMAHLMRMRKKAAK